eukprot:5804977-Pyramimonas_sp.AAC.1
MARSQAKVIKEVQYDRAISSRMVRKWKPREGTFSDPDAKSRWRFHRHKGSDSYALEVHAPTRRPRLSRISCKLLWIGRCSVGQSGRMQRSQGELCRAACGHHILSGSLVRLLGNVYYCGLDGVPLA